jgi:hypothetical protein
MCPETATFTAIKVPVAGGRSPHFPGLTDGQFPYMLLQTQAVSVTLPNRQFTIVSDAFAPSPGAA